MKRYSMQVGADPPREDPKGLWVRFEDFLHFKLDVLNTMGMIADSMSDQAVKLKAVIETLKSGEQFHNGSDQVQ